MSPFVSPRPRNSSCTSRLPRFTVFFLEYVTFGGCGPDFLEVLPSLLRDRELALERRLLLGIRGVGDSPLSGSRSRGHVVNWDEIGLPMEDVESLDRVFT